MSQVAASVAATGKQVAGTESLSPTWSESPDCLRNPWGPSVSITEGTSPSISSVVQKSRPETSRIRSASGRPATIASARSRGVPVGAGAGAAGVMPRIMPARAGRGPCGRRWVRRPSAWGRSGAPRTWRAGQVRCPGTVPPCAAGSGAATGLRIRLRTSGAAIVSSAIR